MNGKGITETNMPFWYNVNDNEFVFKVSSQNCRRHAGFEKDVEYNIDVECKNTQLKSNEYTCMWQGPLCMG